MVSDNLYTVHRNVHRAHDRARTVRFASGLSSFDRKHSKQVCNSQRRAIRTGILAPWSFNKDREKKCPAKNDKSGPGYFRAPEVEQGKVWIVGFEDQGSACGCNVQYPNQNYIPHIAQDVIDPRRDKVIVFSLEYFFTEFANPFLHCAQRTNPSAKDWTKQKGEYQNDACENKRGVVDLLDEQSACRKCINSLHNSKLTNGM